MSGGYWDYGQYKIRNIVYELTKTHEDGIALMDEQMKLNLIKLIRTLKEADVHMQRLDWFLSGDDGQEAYHKRLKEDLDKLI